MNTLQRAILKRLPDFGDKLPICGRFFTGRAWLCTGAEPDWTRVYPRWFVVLCRAEAWIYTTIYKACGGKF